MNRSRLILGLGGVTLVVAVLIAFVPDLLPVPREQLVSLMEGISGAAGLGALALLSGVIAIIQEVWSTETPKTPPALTPILGDDDADDEPSGPVVGEAFDERLGATERVGDRTARGEATIREELRRLAVDVYMQVHSCDEHTALRAVEEGDWTDNAAAAAFVGGPEAPDLPLRVWFRDVISETGAFYNQATRTIGAIYTLQAEAEPDEASLPTGVADLETAIEETRQDEASAGTWGEDTGESGSDTPEAATDGGREVSD